MLGCFWYVYVAIDKFSKWIEYKPLVSATAKKAVELFENIIYRFGLPNSIITDLRTTFIGHYFWNFCEDRCISVKYVSVAHPRANDQVERVNGMILDALKRGYIRKRRSIWADGSKSSQLWSRGYALNLVAAPVCLLTFWSTAQRPYFPWTLPSEHLGWSIIMKSKPQLLEQRTSTEPKKNA